ncbi:MAG: hypothetical protein QW567_03460 [Candidatus Hadarchaeales archaeon]
MRKGERLMSTQEKSRLEALEQRLNEVIRRLSDIERKISALERLQQMSGQPVKQLATQQTAPAVNVEHNYLRRAIASARKEYEKNYK